MKSITTAYGIIKEPLGFIRLSISEFFLSYFQISNITGSGSSGGSIGSIVGSGSSSSNNSNNSDKILTKYLSISIVKNYLKYYLLFTRNYYSNLKIIIFIMI